MRLFSSFDGAFPAKLLSRQALEQVMGQQAAPWRDEEDQQAWLSMLVAAMEEAARPDSRGMPCGGEIYARLYAQLSRTCNSGMCHQPGQPSSKTSSKTSFKTSESAYSPATLSLG